MKSWLSGHFVAVQKKTLNRLKLSQIQGISGTMDVDTPAYEAVESDHIQPGHKGNGFVSDPEVSEVN